VWGGEAPPHTSGWGLGGGNAPSPETFLDFAKQAELLCYIKYS